MKDILLKLLISSLAVLFTAYLLPGVHISGMLQALLVAAVLSVFNVFLKPVLILLTLPITIVTLGLFLLVINAALILLANSIVPGFKVDGFWWALLFSIIVSIVNSLLSAFAKKAEGN